MDNDGAGDALKDGARNEGGSIYFFASTTDGVGRSITAESRAAATFASNYDSLFAHVHGTPMSLDHRSVVERLLNPFVASRHKDGKEDPDLQLPRFDTIIATIR